MAFSFGNYLIKTDNLQISDLYSIYAIMTFSSLILGRVYSEIPDQKKAKAAAKSAFEIIDRKSRIDSMSPDGKTLNNFQGNIEFKDVTFAYPTRPSQIVLNSFNLVVKANSTNALVGPSGSSKSTICSLLLRFYEIDKGGSILLDGVDISELNVQWLRAQIGFVSQEPSLFDCTIRENIENGNPSKNQVIYKIL